MISKNAAFTVVVRIFTILIGFITSILTARYLGPSGRGEYFFVTTLALLLTQFANLGLASSNTYLVAKQEELLDKLLVNSFWVSIIIGFVVSIITIIILYLVHVDVPTGTWVLLLLVPTSIFYLLGVNLLVGINKISAYNFFQIASNLLLITLIVLAGIMGCGVYGFLLASSIGWMLVATFLLFRLNRYTKPSVRRFWFDKESFLLGATYGIKAYLVTLIGMLVLKGNILLLKYFSSEESLGYYSIASQLNDCLGVLPSSIGLVLFPSLVRNTNHKWQEMKKSLLLIIWIMLFACFCGALLVKPFILIAYGARFLPAVEIFWWILPGAFFLGIIVILSQYLAAIGFPKQLIGVWSLAFIVMLGSSLILIPRYGAQGAAMSLSLSYAVLFGLICLLAKKNK